MQHFYESSAGQWRLEVSNEYGTNDASLTYAKLLVEGVPITDTDHDGLDDDWETRWFGSLAPGPLDNPSGDGYNHARKQILGWDPTRFTPLTGPDLSLWNERLARVSFPAAPNQTYQVLTNRDFNHSFGVLTNLAGRLPESEVFVPYVSTPRQFLKVVPAISAAAGP